MGDAAAISVLLPTRGDSPYLPLALGSIEAQSLRPAEVLIVVTGSRVPTQAASSKSGAYRVLHVPGVNLAAALNHGLRAARFPLVARMDDDDECRPHRLAAQASYLAAHPEVVALGTAFERIDARGRTLESAQPPTDPRELRWRLLLANAVAHGSVMLRRDAVLEAGGYDESLDKAQDYDLWLRLTRDGPCVANLPEVLYRYRCDPAQRTASGWASSMEQASTAAAALVRAWSHLPDGFGDAALHGAVTRVLAGDTSGLAEVERVLTLHGPTRAGLTAWLWARHTCARADRAAPESDEAAHRALLGGAAQRLRDAGASQVWLWGAGRHTARLLERSEELGFDIIGIIDDHRNGQMMHGFEVQSPSVLRPGEHVLLSSDAHEEALWRASAAARARGVVVHRLYTHRAPHRRAPRAGAAA